MKSLRLALIALLAVFYSCDSEELQPEFEIELQEVTAYTESNYTITLYAEEEFFVGYNSLIVKVEDANGNLVSGEVSVKPMMHMATMSHSCPLEVSGSSLVDGRFEFSILFVMPSGDMGSWSLDFTINGTEVSVPVEVTSPEQSKLVSFTSAMDESTRYFVAYIDPKSPEVGQNDLEIAVFQKKSMMDWPAVTSLSFEVEPWMVSMDHGSPNNVAPVHKSDGHYKGTVNFTMTGDWQIRLTMMENDQVCGTPYFDLYFQ